MSSSATSSPSRLGSIHGSKSLLSHCKTILNDQQSRLSTKHNLDLDLIDDVRAFIKSKCSIEKEYAQSLIKLANSHNKKYSQFSAENDSQVKTIYTAWKTYLEEVDKFSKIRLAEFEHFSAICDTLKQMRAHKVQVAKKSLDQHLKKMQEELLTSVAEIEKTKKLYFEEEHLAKQARDKEDKIKKRKGGIFSSFTNLQSKKERTSAHREASDIQSTQARNDYIMALAAGNAHLDHYYSLDLQNLMRTLDDDVLDKCRGFILILLRSELNSLTLSTESIEKASNLLNASSADFTNSAFLTESQSSCLRESLNYDFDPCDNDSISFVSLDHNADIALKNEVQKWFSWFSKECRNLNRLSQQLIKCQTLLADGQKTVEVTGSGQVDIEVRIDDIKQQIRKCEISKLKAQARLAVIRESGLEMEDYEKVESEVTTEMKQVSLDVDISIGMPLSRTPSLRSTNISTMSDGGRISSLEGKLSDDQQDTDNYQTPEPELSGRSGRPESSSSDQPESPEREPQSYQMNYENYENYDANANWGDYDPSAAWDNEAPAQESYTEDANYSDYNQYTPAVDGTQIVGKICRTLYEYQSQTQDELSFVANENLTIIEGCDKDWVKAQNDRYMIGFVPAAYLEVVGDAPPDSLPPPQETEASNDDGNISNNGAYIDKELSDQNIIIVKALYDYSATSEEEISFNEGDIIKIISKSDDGWWFGEKDGVQGHFPSMLVEEQGENYESSAFAESMSGEESEESIASPTTPLAPPPSFAPPKPAYLTPHHVIITQPTPEVESRAPIGEEENSADVEIKVETSENEENEPEDVMKEETDPSVVVINPDFTLEKPTRKYSDANNVESENAENLENIENVDEELPLPPPPIILNVEDIEATAEEISETITNEAICDAAKEVASEFAAHEEKVDVYKNEDSDYEDLK